MILTFITFLFIFVLCQNTKLLWETWLCLLLSSVCPSHSFSMHTACMIKSSWKSVYSVDLSEVIPETWVPDILTDRCYHREMCDFFTLSTKITLNITPFLCWRFERHWTAHASVQACGSTPCSSPRPDWQTLCCKTRVQNKISGWKC